MWALFITHYFEMGMIYNAHISWIMVASFSRLFFGYHTKNGTNSTTIICVVLGSKQGGTLKLVNLEHED